MRKIPHVLSRQIYSAKVSSPEQRIIYLGSQTLNWSLRPALPVGNTAVSIEQRCVLLVTLKVRTTTLSKQREPSTNQKGTEKETESVFCISVLHTKENLAFCKLQSYRCICWQHCQLRLCFPPHPFLFIPLQLSVRLCSKCDRATHLHYRQKTQLIFIPDQFSNPVHATAWQTAVLVLLAQEQEQGRWSRVYPAAARPANENKVDQVMGTGVIRLWEVNKDAEEKKSVFCNLIILVLLMTLLRSGRPETGWLFLI